MKKMITVSAAFVLAAVLVVSLCGCGTKNNDTTTSSIGTTVETTVLTTADTTMAENGKITDVSESNKNGVAGKAAEKVSEGVSKAVTDVSKTVSGK